MAIDTIEKRPDGSGTGLKCPHCMTSDMFQDFVQHSSGGCFVMWHCLLCGTFLDAEVLKNRGVVLPDRVKFKRKNPVARWG